MKFGITSQKLDSKNFCTYFFNSFEIWIIYLHDFQHLIDENIPNG